MIRFHGPNQGADITPTQNQVGGAGITPEDKGPWEHARRGHLITIPQGNAGHRRYVAREWDEPAARYMYAVLCQDQENPLRGSGFPQPISETGIAWPETLET